MYTPRLRYFNTNHLLVIVIFRSFNDDTSASDVAQCRMKCGEVRIWKKVVLSHSEHCLGTFLERMEFKTGTVLKKSYESYSYTELVSPPPDKPSAAINGTDRLTYPH